jgi:glycosyltransferase involved in cell wall biosynthesis
MKHLRRVDVVAVLVDEEPMKGSVPCDRLVRTTDWAGQADVLITWGGLLPESLRVFDGVTVGVCHGDSANPWQAEATRGLTRCCNTIVGVSKASHPVFVHSGVDVSRVMVRKPVPKPFAKTLLFMGRVSSEKRPGVVPDVVDALPPEWGAAIVGPDRWCPVREHPRVLRVPATDDVGAWYDVADCVIIPSESEGFCFTMFEAWAARVPVVCGDWPVLREIEAFAGEPLAIRVSNDADWAPAVLNAKVSDKAWRLTKSYFSAPAMADRWEKFLELAVK